VELELCKDEDVTKALATQFGLEYSTWTAISFRMARWTSSPLS